MIQQIYRKPKKIGFYMKRGVDAIELFFDLVFVVTLRYVLEAFVVDFTPEKFILGFVVIINVFMIWLNSTLFSATFFDFSHRHRLSMSLLMIPLLLISAIHDYTQLFSQMIVIMSFVLTRALLALNWYIAIRSFSSNDGEETKYLLMLGKLEIKGAIASLLVASTFLIFQNHLALIIIIALIVEQIIPSIILKYNHEKLKFYVDRMLISERFFMFIILIFGEGLIAVAHTLQAGAINFVTLMSALLIFGTIYNAFIKIQDEYIVGNLLISNRFFTFLLMYTFAITIFISSLAVIGIDVNSTTTTASNKFLMLFGLIAILITYIVSNVVRLHRRKIVDQTEINYCKVDTIVSLLLIIPSIYFILNAQTNFELIIIGFVIIFINSNTTLLRFSYIDKLFKEQYSIIDLEKLSNISTDKH